MGLKEWNELPYMVRMSKKRMYEYLKKELSNTSSEPSSNQSEGEGEGGETGG